MDKQRRCENKCIFCFIDQLPPGMRESLYFKDDDARLSFLFGNYITMTNLSEREVQRIIDMHISPINVSVHTMDPELRVKMMGNRRAGECLSYLRRFADAGLRLNTQLVLCPGINDGEQLVYSLEQLRALVPALQSIAAVPVGITAHREGLYPLRGYTKQEAAAVIDTIDSFNKKNEKEGLGRLAFAADEFYLKAERPIPDAAYYGDFPQLENGVGMWALLREEFTRALSDEPARPCARRVTAVTGRAVYPLIESLAKAAEEKFDGLHVQVVPIENRFFGSEITVSGLLTGRDILEQAKDLDVGDALLFPAAALRHGEEVFLDDRTPQELSEALGVPVLPARGDGAGLLDAFLGSA
jgi:putative radical SAM enzyme (TIGR03279 family)